MSAPLEFIPDLLQQTSHSPSPTGIAVILRTSLLVVISVSQMLDSKCNSLRTRTMPFLYTHNPGKSHPKYLSTYLIDTHIQYMDV